MQHLKDKFNRTIDYLRISITDRCNLRCVYCMPQEGVCPIERKNILTYEEITTIVRIAANLGVKKVRLTGGEPLVRKNITALISAIKKISGIEDISITTNGILLENCAKALAESGADRVNISLDSLKAEKYKEITRGGDINAVFRGMEAAKENSLLPIKINMIPIRGFNDDEIKAFSELTINSDYHVRFIEFMPFKNKDFWSPEKYVTVDEIKSIVETIAPLSPVKTRKNGPSKYFRLRDAKGVIGFISALTHHFCEDCNRLRLTSDGKLRPCLFSDTEIDLKPALRGNNSDYEIERLLRLAIEVKPKGHKIDKKPDIEFIRSMSQIGG